MESKLQKIKQIFIKIKDTRIQVMNVFGILEVKISKLKQMTNEFIKNNHDVLFVFSLDSFKFQSRLIDFEYADMQKYFYALNNRMYCEYYKLYKIISEYVDKTIGSNKTFEMIKTNSNFPIYKDLEPYKQYNFETIEEVHKTIILLLSGIQEHIVMKEGELDNYKIKQHSGLNINNFVNTFEFNVLTVKHNLGLFVSYLDFFHNIHIKHFKRFSKKMKSMDDYLNEDITFDESPRKKNGKDFDDTSSITSSNSNSNSSINSFPPTNNNNNNNNNSNNTEIIPKLKAVPRKSETKSFLKKGVESVINSFKVFKTKTPENSTNDNLSLHIEEKQPDSNDKILPLTEDNVMNLSHEVIQTISDQLSNDPKYMEKMIDELTKTIEEPLVKDDPIVVNDEEPVVVIINDVDEEPIKHDEAIVVRDEAIVVIHVVDEPIVVSDEAIVVINDINDEAAIIKEETIKMTLNSQNVLLLKDTNAWNNNKKKKNKKK